MIFSGVIFYRERKSYIAQLLYGGRTKTTFDLQRQIQKIPSWDQDELLGHYLKGLRETCFLHPLQKREKSKWEAKAQPTTEAKLSLCLPHPSLSALWVVLEREGKK